MSNKFLDLSGLSYLIGKLKERFLGKTDTAASATKLSTARKINGVAFDGTADITITDSTKAPTSHASSATTYGVSSASNYGHAKASGTTPKANGTAAVGSETSSFARGDHVHPLQTSVTGSSGSCTGNAATSTTAAKLGEGGNTGNPMTFNWAGQSGQPTWVWGGNDGTNMYVYNPYNFVVSYADGSNYTAAMPNIHFNSGHNNLSWALPSGGTWRCFLIYNQAQASVVRDLPGGSTWTENPGALAWVAIIVKVS